jgi:hypothetical protein
MGGFVHKVVTYNAVMTAFAVSDSEYCVDVNVDSALGVRVRHVYVFQQEGENVAVKAFRNPCGR